MLLHVILVCPLCQVHQVLLVDLLLLLPLLRPLRRFFRPILLSPKSHSTLRHCSRPHNLSPRGAAVREISTKMFVRSLPLTRSPRSKEMNYQRDLN